MKVRLFQKNNKVKIKKRIQKKPLVLFAGLFAVVGVGALVVSFAAVSSVTIDSTLPVPANVRAYPDDRNIVLTWDKVNNSRVVGYYISYYPKGRPAEVKYRQTIHDQIQLQPLTNGVEYDIFVQSVSGTVQSTPVGSLVYGGGQNRWRQGDGRVSNRTTSVSIAPSSARVDAMRQRLTGFFDDFNTPAGPMDERKWNHAASSCVVPNTAAAFINSQFHAHNMVGSNACDRGGLASRARGVFDITGATTTNPARFEIDMDGATHGRDTWYADFIPVSSRSNGYPIDITSHNDLFHMDNEDPGIFLRLNQGSSNGIQFIYYDANRTARTLQWSNTGNCSLSWDGKIYPENCNFTRKTAGISPLPQSEKGSIVPNVRKHWVMTIAGGTATLYIDSTLIGQIALPSEFVAERRYTIHSTVFSYTTGKDSYFEGNDQITPSVQLFHWDNFGFNGPAGNDVVHSYQEGGAAGTNPTFGKGSLDYSIPGGVRTTRIPVPDQIGTLKDGRGALYLTLNQFGGSTYTWDANDHIVFNGTRYAVPNPATLVRNPKSINSCSQFSEGYVPFSFAIPINQTDIRQGNNEVALNLRGRSNSCNGTAADVLNVHLELPYDKSNPNIPSYTQPLGVFGEQFRRVAEPQITTCDQYRYVEQDLGLPYESGRGNLTPGPCALIEGHASSSPTPPAPPSDTTRPSVTLTAPTNNASYSSGDITLTATATDNVGVNTVEFFVDGSLVGTGGSSSTANSYTFNIAASSLTNGNHTVYAIARDGASNTQQSSTVTITVNIPTPPPTGGGGTPPSTNRFATLPVNATLPSEETCATLVRFAPETRPTNATYNTRRGTSSNDSFPRVTGNYNGTTDQIIQWAACKWGMDEDLLRAQAVKESYWFQNAGGDLSPNANDCTPVYPIGTYNGQSNVCPESVGLMQVRWNYHGSAFEDQNAVFSTAYNIDYYGHIWRTCFNGGYGWLNDQERGGTYAAGDADGCMGVWFSGRWMIPSAVEYITDVKRILNERVWETDGFRNYSAPPNTPINPNPTPPSDTTAPNVAITAPVNGTSVAGLLGINVNATDTQSTITTVRFYLDGSSTPFATDSSAPFSTSWNSATVANGAHTIIARATDSAGNVGVSSAIAIVVNNTVADTTRPTTSITSPSNGATVTGTRVITANASDNVGVARVEFLVDGVSRGTDTTSPFTFSWNTTQYSNSTHTIQSRAYDAADNVTTSATITVTVNNIAPTPTPTPPPTPAPEPTPTRKPGDTNNSGTVDRTDLRIVLINYNRVVTAYTNGDTNGDGRVDRTDLRIVLVNYGK